MKISGEDPPIYNFEVEGTTVMCDGSSLLQGKDTSLWKGIFMAWDEATLNTYLEILEEEYGEHLYAEYVAGQFVRE